MASSPPSEGPDRASSAGPVEYRPADHVDSLETPPTRAGRGPRLGPVGWLRFVWRQLTSMRTALILLLLLAIAAVPGSLVPQTTSDPNGVIAYHQNDPELAAVLDSLGLFSTFSSPWFSAIYILLFISLIGCVIPRAIQHGKAVIARPPRTPARLERMAGHTVRDVAGAPGDAGAALAAAEALLRRRRYRTERYATRAGDSVSAERGYLRETGNLMFHISLMGVLASVAIGGSVGYTGQRVVAEQHAFTNVLSGYDSFYPGRVFEESMLAPFSLRLDEFLVDFEADNIHAFGAAHNFRAHVTITRQGQAPTQELLTVNGPLTVDDVRIYLLGNGYAPLLTIRDPAGDVVFSQPTLFRPLDSTYMSLGVVKVPDGLAEQIGIQGLLYPTAVLSDTGAYFSTHGDLINPLVSLEVWSGDLGLDSGQATNAFTLDIEGLGLTQIAGRESAAEPIQLRPGEVAELPNGLGTIELSAIPRFAAIEMHWDPAQPWLFGFVLAAMAGLLASLFVPRRRVWARALVAEDGTVQLEWAGLAKGEDARLDEAVAALADELSGAEPGGDRGEPGSGRESAHSSGDPSDSRT